MTGRKHRAERFHLTMCRQKHSPTAWTARTLPSTITFAVVCWPHRKTLVIFNAGDGLKSRLGSWIGSQNNIRDQFGSRDADDADDPYSLGVKRVTAPDSKLPARYHCTPSRGQGYFIPFEAPSVRATHAAAKKSHQCRRYAQCRLGCLSCGFTRSQPGPAPAAGRKN
jgi:hypothetical protein